MAAQDTPILGGTGEQFDERFRVTEIRTYPNVSGDERLYRQLTDTVEVMTASGPDVEETYQGLLARGRESEDFVMVVVKTLDAVEEDSYVERWALTQLLIDLHHQASTEYLIDFARRPIPEERSDDTVHGQSTVTEEVILRTTAIEGLARLSRERPEVSEALHEIIATSEFVAMRRAAWFAIVDGGDEHAQQKAIDLLRDRGDSWIAELRRIPVQEAEQHNLDRIDIDPTREIPNPYNE